VLGCGEVADAALQPAFGACEVLVAFGQGTGGDEQVAKVVGGPLLRVGVQGVVAGGRSAASSARSTDCWWR
jgi:hypothetical protein